MTSETAIPELSISAAERSLDHRIKLKNSGSTYAIYKGVDLPNSGYREYVATEIDR